MALTNELREEIVELFTKVKPELRDPVFSPDEFRIHFQTPYRASHLTALTKYEMKHRKIFCRSCIKRNDKGMLLCYQLLCEESDNLLENRPGEWVSIRCMNEDCDFDLITKRPKVSVDPTPYQIEQIRKSLAAQGIVGSQAQNVIGTHLDQLRADADRHFQQSAAHRQHSAYMREEQMRRMQALGQAAAAPPSHALDALRYAGGAEGLLGLAKLGRQGKKSK